MAAGAVFVNTGLQEISKMGGIYKKMPVTSVCFAAASLGIAGLPLMAGFVSKFNILEGALAVGRPFAVVTLIAAALLALTYLMPVVSIFFGQNKDREKTMAEGQGVRHLDAPHLHAPHKGAVIAMVIPLTLTVVIGIILGFAPNAGAHLYEMAQMAAESVTGEGGIYLAG